MALPFVPAAARLSAVAPSTSSRSFRANPSAAASARPGCSRRGRRRALTVTACGNCTRRELITGVIGAGATRPGRRDDDSGLNRARVAYDAQFARTMEDGMADYETKMTAVKDELFSHIVGTRVLEVGIGTGPNLRYYAGLDVTGVEPNVQSFEYARAAAARNGVRNFRVVEGVGEALPLEDASVDTVVATLVMCTVNDPAAVAREIRRVLRPGGAYVFLDHVAAPRGTPLRAAQELFEPLNRLAYEGCRLTRDPTEAILAAGFSEVAHKHFVAGAANDSWLVTPPGRAPGRTYESPLDAVEPHFLLSPHVAGVARA